MKHIDQLARIARNETPPSIDVSRRVVASIRALETENMNAPLKWVAALSGVSAVAVSFIAIPLYLTWSDPITLSFFNLFRGFL